MKRFILALSLAALTIVFLSPPGFGDTIYLKNGRKFEGKVVREDATTVWFKIKGLGEQPFRKADVVKIEKGETVFDQYEAKRKALAADDAEGFYQLGQ
jgi:hypothetical protein